MIYLAFLGGVVLGSLITNILFFRTTAIGTLQVDHRNETVLMNLHSDDFKDRKKKHIIVNVDHNADLSQK